MFQDYIEEEDCKGLENELKYEQFEKLFVEFLNSMEAMGLIIFDDYELVYTVNVDNEN